MLPSHVDYPLTVIGDLHGQRSELERLVDRLEKTDVWSDAAIVFLGDFVDRGEDVPGTLDLVLDLLARPAGGTAVRGNHDHAFLRVMRWDGGPRSPYWLDRWRRLYDSDAVFEGYLGTRPPIDAVAWEASLAVLDQAISSEHRDFLANLPWLVEAQGHLFLHCGLSPELGADAVAQVAALHERVWNQERLKPRDGSATSRFWQVEYPVWLGADRGLSANPLPHPTKVQVTGHERVVEPDANSVRIRLDTSGGQGHLTACVLRGPCAEPLFISSRPRGS